MTATNRTEQLINTVLIPAICNLGGTVPPRPKVTNLEDYQFLLLQELVNHLVNTVNTVASVFGRSGNVVAQMGDYTAAQVGADPAGIAAAGDATHVAATDPHPQYATDSDLSAHTGAVAPHSGHATTTALTAHTGNTSNPHATTAAQVAALAIANNLSDLSNPATSRTNLSVPAISDLTAHTGASLNVHGLPANVNVVGNRNAAGEYIQRGSATPNSALSAYSLTNYRSVSVSFPNTFSAAPRVLVGGNFPAAVQAVSTSGFTCFIWGDATLTATQTVYWTAIGA